MNLELNLECGVKIKLYWNNDELLQLEHWDGFTWNQRIQLTKQEIKDLYKALKFMEV